MKRTYIHYIYFIIHPYINEKIYIHLHLYIHPYINTNIDGYILTYIIQNIHTYSHIYTHYINKHMYNECAKNKVKHTYIYSSLFIRTRFQEQNEAEFLPKLNFTNKIQAGAGRLKVFMFAQFYYVQAITTIEKVAVKQLRQMKNFIKFRTICYCHFGDRRGCLYIYIIWSIY